MVKTELLKKVFRVGCLKFGSFILLYPTAILLAHGLGSEGYGVYGVLMAVSPILAVIFLFGLDQYSVRKIASTSEFKRYGNAFLHSLVIPYFKGILLICFMLLVFVWASTYFLFGTDAFTSTSIIFSVAVCLINIQVWRKYFSAVTRAMNRPEAAQFPEVFVQPALMLLGCSVIYYFSNSFSLNFVLVLLIISHLIALLVAFNLMPKIEHKYPFKWKSGNFKILLAISSPFLGVTVLNQFNMYIDRIMLAAIDSVSSSGVYLIASRNAALLTTCVGILQFVMGPIIAKLKLDRSQEMLQTTIRQHVLMLLVLSVTGTVLLITFGENLVSLFGEEFSEATLPLFILIACYQVSFLFGPAIQYFFMLDDSKFAFKLSLASVAINICIGLALIPYYGILGAAIGTGVSEIVMRACACICFYKKRKVHTSIVCLLIGR